MPSKQPVPLPTSLPCPGLKIWVAAGRRRSDVSSVMFFVEQFGESCRLGHHCLPPCSQLRALFHPSMMELCKEACCATQPPAVPLGSSPCSKARDEFMDWFFTMWANTPIYSLPYSHHQVTWGNAVLHTGKEQFLEKHFNGRALQALMGSNISAASVLTVLSVQPGETCRGKSKGKPRALGASFYTTCAGQLEQYGGLLSLAKSKEPPVQRRTPS